MKRRLPFRYLLPAFFGGLLDDPLLFLRIRPLRRALLFDCGQIAHLAKRTVKAIDTVFITHAHMDHVMGIPTLVRHHHASPRPLDIFGPPGIADRVYHQLKGYEWNLHEPGWFTVRVHEVGEESIRHFSLPGPEGFVSRFDGEEPRQGREIWSCRYVAVEAELLDHKIPVLAFRITERPYFAVDRGLLEQRGIMPGDWIRDLKSRVWKGNEAVRVEVPGGEGGDDPFAFYSRIAAVKSCASIGYLTDVGWTARNREKMAAFLGGVTVLCSECTFLAADVAKARASYHLCTDDLNDLLATLVPRFLMPMHLSKGYLLRTVDLYRELHPPAGTDILRLPNHIVPPPLMASDVEEWLRPPPQEQKIILQTAVKPQRHGDTESF